MPEPAASRLARRILRPLWRARALGLLSETYFWWRWIATRGLQWPEEFARRMDPQRPVVARAARSLALLPGERLRILDVGAGAATSLGYRLDGRQLDITAVDVLARVYARLWALYRMAPPVATQPADAERLTETFEPASFDFVFSQNSLDHAARPAEAIEQMVAVTRPGGRLLLVHAVDEALNEGYTGLHQWNFSDEAGDFVLWNPGARINMTARLAPACGVKTERNGAALVVEIVRER